MVFGLGSEFVHYIAGNGRGSSRFSRMMMAIYTSNYIKTIQAIFKVATTIFSQNRLVT